MGYGLGVFLLAVGLILALAVTDQPRRTSTSRWSAGSWPPPASWYIVLTAATHGVAPSVDRRDARTPTAASSVTERNDPPPARLSGQRFCTTLGCASGRSQVSSQRICRGLPTWVQPAVGAHGCPGFEVW